MTCCEILIHVLADAIPPLIQMLKSALLRQHDTVGEFVTACQCKALIATTKRNLATLESFKAAAVVAGIHLQDLTSMARLNTMQFYHHATLQHQRGNIVLHELSIAK